jgi:HK97 family phage portal protein
MSILGWPRRWMGGLANSMPFAAFYGGRSKSGQDVSVASTLNLSAAWACMRLRSQTKSTLPLGFYERVGADDRKPRNDHWLAQILNVSPNAEQTPAEFWEGVYGCTDLRGNFFARKAGLKPDGTFVSLETMNPDSVSAFREDGEIRYRYRDPDGKLYTLQDREIFRVSGLALGEHLGLSPMHFGRQVFGSAQAADEQASKMFESGLQSSGFLKVDQALNDKQREQLKGIMDDFAGSKNAGKLMILEAGMSYQALSLKPQEAQLLDTRKFSIEEICRWFGVPPILVGHAAEGQTMFGSGVEQIFLMWLTTSLRNDLVRVEQAIQKRLLPAGERPFFYAEHNVEGLLRADSAGRAALYQSLVNVAGITPAEIRRKENLPFKEGSDILLVQGALVKLLDLGKVPANDAQAVRSALQAFLAVA